MLVTSYFSFFHYVFSRPFGWSPQKHGTVWYRVNILKNNKVLNLSKLKEFADSNYTVALILDVEIDWVENIRKGENAAILLVDSILSFSETI